MVMSEPHSLTSGAPNANPMRDVAALIGGQTLLQVAGGLLGVWLPLQMKALDFTGTEIGFVASAFGVGFLAGAWFAPIALRAIGAIRTYAASAAIACVATLLLHASDQSWAWGATRALAGVAIAIMFAAAEGWLAAAIPNARRGDVTGFYMLCTKLGLASGPFIIGFAHPEPNAAGPIMAAAAFFALSLVPISIADTPPPPPPSGQRMTPGTLFGLAPAAFVAALGAGLVNGAVLSLAPLYADARGGAQAAASFQAAAWIGSLLVQWHAGKLSDRIDRRIVLALLIGIPGLAALGLAWGGERLSLSLVTVLFGLWGAGALSYYGIAVAHLGDRTPRADLPAAAAGLLFVWAAGTIVGPAVGGILVEIAGSPLAVFWQAALGSAIMVPWVLWRTKARPAAKPEDKVGFRPVQTNSVPGQGLSMPSSSKPEDTSPRETG
jgi:MFS family permease